MYKLDQATEIRKEEAFNVNALENYLHRELNISSPLKVLQYPSGYSNLTYLLNMGTQGMVLRRPPYGANIKSGHDMHREFKIISSLNNGSLT